MRSGISRLFCLAAVAAVAAACQTAPPSVEKTSIPSYPADLTERFVYQTVYDMRDRFVAEDVAGFMKHISEGFYKGRARFQESLESAFATASISGMEVFIEGVEVEEHKVSAVVRWSGSFEGEGGVEQEEGETLLLFHRSDGISLVDIRKDPLFGVEGF